MSPQWVYRVGNVANILGLWAFMMGFSALYLLTGWDVFYWLALASAALLGVCGGVWVAEQAFGKRG